MYGAGKNYFHDLLNLLNFNTLLKQITELIPTTLFQALVFLGGTIMPTHGGTLHIIPHDT